MGTEKPAWRCEQVRAGNLVLDPETLTARLDDKPIHLTQQEYQLLALLAQNAGTVLHHRYIAAQIWETAGERESRRLSVLVSRLRVAISDAEPYALETVRNRGYGFLLRTVVRPGGNAYLRRA